MSNEIADALRRLADSIERGESVPDPVEACVVLCNAAGINSGIYVGRKAPVRDAGLFLLGMGVQRLVVGMPPATPVAAPTPLFGTGVTRGSTH